MLTAYETFCEFAHRQGAEVWLPSDPALAELVSHARDNACGSYGTGMISPRNDQGDEWRVEAHYIDLACRPNAFVDKFSGVYCVAMPYTTAIHFYSFCRMLFQDPNIFPFIGHGLSEAPASISYPPIPQPYDVRLEFVDACKPTDPHRQVMADWVAETALEMIWHHEFGHIINGHIDFARSNGLPSRISESATADDIQARTNGLSDRQMMEIYADMFSFQPLVRRLVSMHADPSRPQYLSQTQHAAMLRFAAYLVNATWCLGDIAHYNELDGLMRSRTHPPSGYRLFFNNENFNDVLKAYRIDEETIEASDRMNSETINYAINRYQELGLVAHAIMKHQDEMFAYAYRMKKPAEYFARWAPFNFYPKG